MAMPTKMSDSLNVKNRVARKKVKGMTPIKMLYTISVKEAPITMLGIIHKAKKPMLYRRYFISRFLNVSLKVAGRSPSSTIRVVLIDMIDTIAVSAIKKSIYKSELTLPYKKPV